MAYELAQLADSSSPIINQPMREEKVLSAYAGSDSRYAQAMAAKAATPATQNNGANINENAVPAESTETSGATRALSPQLAALARKEQKFRQEQAALKAQRTALDAETKEIAELKALKAKIAAGDYSEIDKMVDYEKLVQHKIGKDPKAEELDKVRAEIAALKEAQEKDVSSRYEAAVSQRRTAVKSLIASNDEYTSIRELKAEEAVVQHILDTWENEEVELTPEDAAKEVEAALLEKANKWIGLSKLKKSDSVEAVPEKKELPPLKTGMKTLTNTMASTGEIKRPNKPYHLMTETERYAEARRRYEEKYNQGMR